MRTILILLLFLFFQSASAQPDPIKVDERTVGYDMADRAVYLVDSTGKKDIHDLLRMEDGDFHAIEVRRKNFGRSVHPHWVRFQLKNPTQKTQRLLLEASRAMTNDVKLYRVFGDYVLDSARSGDHIPFGDRPHSHRRPVFPVQLGPLEEGIYYMRLKGNGATTVLSLKPWTADAFHRFDQVERLLLGFFYGFLLFVTLIFSFFYLELKERSFLFFFLYVINIGLLLFTLDGFSYRFFFSGLPYWADRSVLLFSFSSILFHVLYARDYLRFWKHLPKVDGIVKGFAALAGIFLLMSFSYGPLYRVGFPLSHLLSFIGPLFILGCIFYMRRNGIHVSLRFLAAFILLVMGVIVLLLGNVGVIPPSAFTVHWLKFGVLGEVCFLSLTMAEKYRHLKLEKEEARKESLEKLQELNHLKDEYNKELEETVAQRTSELEERKAELETERAKLREVNMNVFSSIRYAERIQKAILPVEEEVTPLFRDHFVLSRPRDIVSGDICWFGTVDGKKGRLPVLAAVDCTGHGVPGAFLSILAHDFLNQIIKDQRTASPSRILDALDRSVQETFERSRGETEEVRDGMDMGMVLLDLEQMKLRFSGAQNPCYLIREGELYEFRGDKRAIGEKDPNKAPSFTEQAFELQKGDAIYLFSDGYPDQFGGEKGKKFKYKPFKAMLQRLHHLEMKEQHRIIENEFDEWKGDHEQVDDVLVIGVRV